MFTIHQTAAAVLAAALSGAVFAAPVQYSFSTESGVTGASHIVALLGDGAQASGSFVYNNGGAFYGGSGALGYEPGFALYAVPIPGAMAYSGLTGQVAGLGFSDVFGSAAVGNDTMPPLNVDVLSLVADPTPKVGQNGVPADVPRQLQGFTIGDYTLSNVRLFWSESATQPDFLDSYALPTALPSFKGRVMLEFVRTDDPTNTAGVPYGSNTVFLDGLTVQAVVPEPGSFALGLTGLLAVGVALRRRQAR